MYPKNLWFSHPLSVPTTFFANSIMAPVRNSAVPMGGGDAIGRDANKEEMGKNLYGHAVVVDGVMVSG